MARQDPESWQLRQVERRWRLGRTGVDGRELLAGRLDGVPARRVEEPEVLHAFAAGRRGQHQGRGFMVRLFTRAVAAAAGSVLNPVRALAAAETPMPPYRVQILLPSLVLGKMPRSAADGRKEAKWRTSRRSSPRKSG